ALRKEHSYDFVLTAHHADDNLETFLIHLSRGTGLSGLLGIPAVNDYIVRPFLRLSRAQLEEFAANEKIRWREDSSNRSDKYLRNKIRHHITPVLKSLNPTFTDSFNNTLRYLQQSASLAEDAVTLMYNQIVSDVDNQKHIDL